MVSLQRKLIKKEPHLISVITTETFSSRQTAPSTMTVSTQDPIIPRVTNSTLKR